MIFVLFIFFPLVCLIIWYFDQMRICIIIYARLRFVKKAPVYLCVEGKIHANNKRYWVILIKKSDPSIRFKTKYNISIRLQTYSIEDRPFVIYYKSGFSPTPYSCWVLKFFSILVLLFDRRIQINKTLGWIAKHIVLKNRHGKMDCWFEIKAGHTRINSIIHGSIIINEWMNERTNERTNEWWK